MHGHTHARARARALKGAGVQLGKEDTFKRRKTLVASAGVPPGVVPSVVNSVAKRWQSMEASKL